ncbi:Transcriptional regulator, TetR family [Leucobacter sp. 7(1)]|uniref:TetR/AcrR family transcriptional regulator n=1 Tax=Leucobacter sp. 7(1) TaxID=1255613 RepID=UPI00097ED765|nr:TetR/AcrR family transcriptional regulator [Leucobacter sp. 7(1)]SJN13159.1 Transcriptional regulator, TetR family [Leucobacter sp. 7(1)]
MAAPDKTTLPEIVRTASEILERDGVDGLTMQAVAVGVGVRAPSLYKRVDGRETLLQLVADAKLRELGARLDAAQNLADLADRFRAFGHERPESFRLIMGQGQPRAGGSTTTAAPAAASAAVLRLVGRVVPADNVLDAARTLTAWATGFVSMELGGGFHLDGDIERAWRFGVARMEALIGGRDQEQHGTTPESRS